VDLNKYLILKKERLDQKLPTQCFKCLRLEKSCYCSHIKQFDPQIKFVILTHPIEFKRKIATGRMTYLTLKNAEFFVGVNFLNNKRIKSLVEDESYSSFVLYPGEESINLSLKSCLEKKELVASTKICVFVLDGTWHTSKRMLRENPFIRDLPKISFNSKKTSQFRVRKQPQKGCLSTIEAVCETIEHLGPACGFSLEEKKHHALLHVFNHMVNTQLKHIKKSYLETRDSRHLSYRIKKFNRLYGEEENQ